LQISVEIVCKPAEQCGFAVHPKRWVVERSLAWLTAHRRLARDYERDPAVSEAFTRWAAINMMIRRLDRGRPAKRQTRHPLNPPTNSPLKHSLSEQLRREPAFRRSPLSPHNVRSIWHTFGA
jgi:hypothetical protein